MTLTNLREKSAGQILRALLTAFSAAFLIAAVCAPDRAEIFTGFVRIISKPGQLTKDYFCSEIGSLSGALLNMGLVGLICNAMMLLPGAAAIGLNVRKGFIAIDGRLALSQKVEVGAVQNIDEAAHEGVPVVSLMRP